MKHTSLALLLAATAVVTVTGRKAAASTNSYVQIVNIAGLAPEH